MQFAILFVGIMVFMFFQFNPSPMHFNQANLDKLENTTHMVEYEKLQAQHNQIFEEKQLAIRDLVKANRTDNESTIGAAQIRVNALMEKEKGIRAEVKELIVQQDPNADTEDTDYVFINFVTHHLPIGLVGLLLAVIFSAAMSSTASELNALATTTVVDLYRRSVVTEKNDNHYLYASKFFTIAWGVVALTFATFASLFDNLIEAVNIVGSVFYGAILGVFVVAFFFKWVKGNAVFWGAVIGELLVITLFTLTRTGVIDLAYLWLNLIGCLLVVFLSIILQVLIGGGDSKSIPA